jgi:hypothetical protein
MALAVGIPIALGYAAGNLQRGVIAAFGAMIGTLAVQLNGGTVTLRIGTIVSTVFGVTAGAAFGSAMERGSLLGGLALFSAAFLSGRVYGTHPVIETVVRFIAIGVAVGVGLRPTAWIFGLLYLSGGAIAVVITLLIARFCPPQAESQRAVIRERVKGALQGELGSTRFAVIYACTVLIALLAANSIGVTRPYWAALTVFLVMRPDKDLTFTLAASRTAGTLLGVLFVGLLAHLPFAEAVRAIAAIVFALLIPIARAYNAALGVAAVTTVVLLMLDLLPAVAGGHGIFAARLYDTLVGCVLVLLGDWIAVSRLR